MATVDRELDLAHLVATLAQVVDQAADAPRMRTARNELGNEAFASRMLRDLAGADGPWAHASTFTALDVLQACSQRLALGARVADVEALAAAVLDPTAGIAVRVMDPDIPRGVVRRHDGRLVVAGARPATALRRCSRPSSALTEAVDRVDAGDGVVDAPTVQRMLAGRPSLSVEQREMATRLHPVGRRRGRRGRQGRGGARRTRWTRPAPPGRWAAIGWSAARWRPAPPPSWKPERGSTVTHWTGSSPTSTGAPRAARLTRTTVLVVDEAAMVGTRKLARLLARAADVHAKVVLVGDHRQLPEIDAGGLFRALARRLPAVELHENRRQQQQWERDALDELRCGAAAVTSSRTSELRATPTCPRTATSTLA